MTPMPYVHAPYNEILSLSSDKIDVRAIGPCRHISEIKNVNKSKLLVVLSFGEYVYAEELENFCKLHSSVKILFFTSQQYTISHLNCTVITVPEFYGWYATTITPADIHSNIDKYFLSLNNRVTLPRHSVWQLVIKFKLLDKFNLSYNFEDRFAEGRYELFKRYQSMNDNCWFNSGVDWDSEFNKLPLTLPDDTFAGNDWGPGNVRYWQETFASIILETYAHDCDPFFTEKTFKALAYGHPFLLHGAPGSLAKLHSLGFKTFGDIFDESYDSITNTDERMEFIMHEILRICDKPREELNIMQNKIQLISEHNRQYFWNEFKQKYISSTNTVANILKNID